MLVNNKTNWITCALPKSWRISSVHADSFYSAITHSKPYLTIVSSLRLPSSVISQQPFAGLYVSPFFFSRFRSYLKRPGHQSVPDGVFLCNSDGVSSVGKRLIDLLTSTPVLTDLSSFCNSSSSAVSASFKGSNYDMLISVLLSVYFHLLSSIDALLPVNELSLLVLSPHRKYNHQDLVLEIFASLLAFVSRIIPPEFPEVP